MNNLCNMMRTCGIPDIPNVAGDRPTVLFIQSQGLVTVADITILNVKDVPNMIKGHNSVPNQAARLGSVQQRKIQALIWWTKDRIRCGIEIAAADWNAAALADTASASAAAFQLAATICIPQQIRSFVHHINAWILRCWTMPSLVA